MKQKQTLKSFAELSADSLPVANGENKLTEPQKFQASAEPRQNKPSESPRPDLQGYHRWGINE